MTKVFGAFVTTDSGQGFEAVRIMNARTTVPIHYGDYTPFGSPLADLKRAVTDAGL